ncbi:hypothetical protein BpHYR1_018541 [Brachionus plicatilis]|uniref:Uncharacterized protein n=1 Tax=Brachionus plicatilis TaxID=10195 RepID=A0A3M7PFH9_BRAPC|nr:hypothetical protein BpHYR1_018541 [Brachionus plicatilis]
MKEYLIVFNISSIITSFKSSPNHDHGEENFLLFQLNNCFCQSKKINPISEIEKSARFRLLRVFVESFFQFMSIRPLRIGANDFFLKILPPICTDLECGDTDSNYHKSQPRGLAKPIEHLG